MARLVLLLLALLFSAIPARGVAKSSSASHGSSSAKGSKSHSANKTEHVSGYTTKSGKKVAPYNRAPPGQGTGKKKK